VPARHLFFEVAKNDSAAGLRRQPQWPRSPLPAAFGLVVAVGVSLEMWSQHPQRREVRCNRVSACRSFTSRDSSAAA